HGLGAADREAVAAEAGSHVHPGEQQPDQDRPQGEVGDLADQPALRDVQERLVEHDLDRPAADEAEADPAGGQPDPQGGQEAGDLQVGEQHPVDDPDGGPDADPGQHCGVPGAVGRDGRGHQPGEGDGGTDGQVDTADHDHEGHADGDGQQDG